MTNKGTLAAVAAAMATSAAGMPKGVRRLGEHLGDYQQISGLARANKFRHPYALARRQKNDVRRSYQTKPKGDGFDGERIERARLKREKRSTRMNAPALKNEEVGETL